MSRERRPLSHGRRPSGWEDPHARAGYRDQFPFPFCAQISRAKRHRRTLCQWRTRFRPLIAGGGQENERRGGTENVASIVGLGKAAEAASEYLSEGKAHVRSMRDRFEKAVLEAVSGAAVN